MDDKKDAERYRWLRKNNSNPVDMGIPWCVHLVRENGIPTIKPIEEVALDAEIDLLMEYRKNNIEHLLGKEN